MRFTCRRYQNKTESLLWPLHIHIGEGVFIVLGNADALGNIGNVCNKYEFTGHKPPMLFCNKIRNCATNPVTLRQLLDNSFFACKEK